MTSGGLSIYATVDKDVQDTMESVFENSSNFPSISEDGVKPQAAMMVVDPKTGHILGVVGGRGERPRVWCSTAQRSPSVRRVPRSSRWRPMRPALDQGLITPYSVLTDMPVFNNNGKAWPRNENRTYAGQTTIMQAVADSTNTIAVNVMDKLTPQSAYNFLTEKLGFTSLSKERY